MSVQGAVRLQMRKPVGITAATHLDTLGIFFLNKVQAQKTLLLCSDFVSHLEFDGANIKNLFHTAINLPELLNIFNSQTTTLMSL